MKNAYISAVPALIAFLAVTGIIAIDIYTEQSGITGAVILDNIKGDLNIAAPFITALTLIAAIAWFYRKY